jgi:hypothetical protein
LRQSLNRLFLWSIVLVLAGVSLNLLGSLCQIVLIAAGAAHSSSRNPIAWFGALLALTSVAVELFFLMPYRRRYPRLTDGDGYEVTGVTVALTAYNDEESIGLAVTDFLSHPLVRRVIVVSNNSVDATEERGRNAGAVVCNEPKPGYGQCVYRCLTEAVAFEDTECVALCEGDMTFRARDLSKLLAYLPHAEIVNGTRIVEQLRAYETQLTTFMYYGNFFVGKLLEAKHFGKGTFTDVGTTYKICRRETLQRLLPTLNPQVNLEFNAYFLDTALTRGFRCRGMPHHFP